MTAYQAHREGIRKLREWEADDFDLARHKSHMRLFDDEMEDTGDGGPRGQAKLSRLEARPCHEVRAHVLPIVR